MSILNEIINYKKEELSSTKSNVPLSELQSRIGDAGPTKSFKSAIQRNKGETLKLIAELKKASPSKLPPSVCITLLTTNKNTRST